MKNNLLLLLVVFLLQSVPAVATNTYFPKNERDAVWMAMQEIRRQEQFLNDFAGDATFNTFAQKHDSAMAACRNQGFESNNCGTLFAEAIGLALKIQGVYKAMANDDKNSPESKLFRAREVLIEANPNVPGQTQKLSGKERTAATAQDLEDPKKAARLSGPISTPGVGQVVGQDAASPPPPARPRSEAVSTRIKKPVNLKAVRPGKSAASPNDQGKRKE